MDNNDEIQTNQSITGASDMLTFPTNEENAKVAKEKRKKLLLRELDITSKRGVCYLSRVPPQMDPLKLRQTLSQYGEVLRIYLVPEGPFSHVYETQLPKCVARVLVDIERDNFRKGVYLPFTKWIEFAKKSVAKRVAHILNGEQIGGKKRSRFYYDLWNIKYLRGFKWDHLTDEQAKKYAEREKKLALEISAARKERDFYLAKLDQSSAINAMQERAKKKQKILETSGSSDNGGKSEEIKIVRQFSQIPPVSDKAAKVGSKLSKDFLAGIFGKSSS